MTAATTQPLARARWTVVAEQECKDLWTRGRGPLLVFTFSLLLSAMTYLSATNQALNFLEQREAVNLTLQVALAVGVLLTLVVSADAITGERERGTLEWLLLAPVSRRAIVGAKLLAAMTLWLGCLIVAFPYLWALGHGVAITRQAALLALCVGTTVAVGLSSLGLLISAIAGSNKTSLATSLLLLFVLFAPTQVPALPKTGIGELLVRINPIGSALHYISTVLVNRQSWTHDLSYLAAPLVLAVLAGSVVIAMAPRLVSLTGGVRKMNSLAAVMIALQTVQPPQPTISFSHQDIDATIGQVLHLESAVTRTGGRRMIAHLNVTSLDGTYVDLEDWTREVTQPVPPGPETQLDWEVQAVNAGHFAIYAVLIPDDHAPLIVSPPIHITVTAHQTLNTGTALPIAITTPAVLGLATLAGYLRRHKR